MQPGVRRRARLVRRLPRRGWGRHAARHAAGRVHGEWGRSVVRGVGEQRVQPALV